MRTPDSLPFSPSLSPAAQTTDGASLRRPSHARRLASLTLGLALGLTVGGCAKRQIQPETLAPPKTALSTTSGWK